MSGARPEPDRTWTEEDSARVLEIAERAAPGPWTARPMSEVYPDRGFSADQCGVFAPDGSVPCSAADSEMKAAGRNDLPRAVLALRASDAWGMERAASLLRVLKAARALLAAVERAGESVPAAVRRRAEAVLRAAEKDSAVRAALDADPEK